jgi:hypothetical protein
MSERKLYIIPCHHTPITSLTVLIRSLYSNPDGSHRSYARPTYKDTGCSIIECKAERRSFEDLLCLAQTYFPETTEVQLMSVLKELNLRYYFCSDIRKLVFHYKGDFYLSGNSFRSHFNQNGAFRCYKEGTYTPQMLSDIYEQLIRILHNNFRIKVQESPSCNCQLFSIAPFQRLVMKGFAYNPEIYPKLMDETLTRRLRHIERRFRKQ